MRFYAALLISTILYPVSAGAQDIPTQAETELALEWQSPMKVNYCLEALRLYTTGRVAGGAHLGPDEAEKHALAQLLMGTPGDEDLYKAAMTRSDFLEILARANTLNTQPPGQAALFVLVQQHIDEIYNAPSGKQSLIAVQKAAVSDKHLALFLLLDAYPKANGVANATVLELFRAAFKANSNELFNLVGKKNPPPGK